MDCNTTTAKAISAALRREEYKVNPKEDARGKFWEVVEGDQPILEFWFIRGGIQIAPSQMGRGCSFLSSWSYARNVIQAVKSKTISVADLTREPIKPRQEKVRKPRQRKSCLEVVR